MRTPLPLLPVVLLAFACNGTRVTATIGPEGGTLATDGVVLTIPSGALEAPVELSLEATGEVLPGPLVQRSPVYDVGPHGTVFTKAAQVDVTLDPAGEGAKLHVPVNDGWSGRGGVVTDGHLVAELPQPGPFVAASVP